MKTHPVPTIAVCLLLTLQPRLPANLPAHGDRSGAFVVGALLPDNQAAEHGIKIGDKITHVNGIPSAKLSCEKFLDLLKPGTVEFKMEHASPPSPSSQTAHPPEQSHP